jgi:ATP-binding cassette subfamily F protein 3
MEDYRNLVLGRDAGGDGAPSSVQIEKAQERKQAADARASLSALRKKVSAAEERMAKLEGLIAKVDAALAGGAFSRDPAKAGELSRQRAELQDALAAAEEDWLAASGALDGA